MDLPVNRSLHKMFNFANAIIKYKVHILVIGFAIIYVTSLSKRIRFSLSGGAREYTPKRIISEIHGILKDPGIPG